MKKTIGILAHVDGGKTTFSEQLLYHAGAIRTPGRVDRRDTVMDASPIEQERGITIFSDQGFFEYGGNTYYLMDTPGHVDFSAETERAVMALDYAVMLLDGTGGVPAHAITLFRLLERYRIPAFFFINKMDLEGADAERTLQSIRSRLTEDAVLVHDPGELDMEGELAEFTAERDDGLLEAYLEGEMTREQGLSSLRESIRSRRAFVAMAGSALRDEGIAAFLQVFDCLTGTDYRADGDFAGLVYKVRHDSRGQRITFIKVERGTLRVKEEFAFRKADGEVVREKVNQLFCSFGAKYGAIETAEAGDLLAVTGLSVPVCGQRIYGGGVENGSEGRGGRPENGVGGRGSGLESGLGDRGAGLENGPGAGPEIVDFGMVPALEAQVEALDGTDSHRLLEILRQLEDEEPQLAVRDRRMPDGKEQICVRVMGAIQLEVLRSLIEERFGVKTEFMPPQVLYRETIEKPVMGYGHYEPLRHYAEVNLLLEPAPRGSGISFESRCHVDVLSANYQNLIRTHVFEKTHRGILTGSPLTDVRVVLVNGRSHLKHTEGGDFRESTYRAIRQGLEKAQNVLLEPWYRFEITAPAEYLGRILSDVRKRFGEAEAPEQCGDSVVVYGEGPVASFMDYSVELASATRGSASVSMVSAGYRPCHNTDEVVERIGYDKGADTENPSSSVFCSHGAGFVVNWDEAEAYMHCLRG